MPVPYQLKPLLHPIIRMSWLRLICKGHLGYTCDFITEYQGRTDPAMKNWHAHFLCVHTVWL